MSDLDVSDAQIIVMFSTFNGETTLPLMLDAYEKITPPSRSWAIVAVDNASKDNTPEILRQFAKNLPLAIVYEARPGKNTALNCGLYFAGSGMQLCIFTDDDAIPAPDFLIEWEKVLESRTENKMFGGTVEPYFSVDPPDWLWRFRSQFGELYAITDKTEGPIEADEIFGPNMAVRGSVLERGFVFDENIGPNMGQANYTMGSETEFCERVASQMAVDPWFAAGPRVQHIVRQSQMTKEFVGKRAFRHGRGVAQRRYITGSSKIGIRFLMKLKLMKGLARLILLFRIDRSWWTYNWVKGFLDWSENRR